MQKNNYLPVFALTCSIVIPTAHAAAPLILEQASLEKIQSHFQVILPTDTKKPLVKIAHNTSIDSLNFIQQHTDGNKVSHIRLQQEYAGFPVFGGYAIVHSSRNAQTLMSAGSIAKNKVKMNGVIYEGLKNELGQVSAEFLDNKKIALQKFAEQYQGGVISEESITPMVYVDKQHHAFWAYKISLFVSYDNGIPERPTAIVDAKTFKPFLHWNDVKTLRSPAKGMGFGGNRRSGIHTFGKDYPPLLISRDNESEICYMENANVKVVDMEHQYTALRVPMQFNCHHGESLPENTYWTGRKEDGYDRKNGAYSPSNDALYIGQVIKNLYSEWFNVEVLTYQNKPMKLVLRVHYGDRYENAYWDGRQMTFGDGDTFLYPLVSMGIGAHEISHGFTEQHSDLLYHGQSGGMNEAFSDMAAQAAEYYSQGKNTWMIGAEVLKESSGYVALRFMDFPSRDGRSIDRTEQYHEDMDVHFSSGVYNRLFYLLANQPQWNTRQAFHVMVKANMDYWTPTSTFDEGGCGIMNATQDLAYSVEDVKQVLDQVGIDYSTCAQG